MSIFEKLKGNLGRKVTTTQDAIKAASNAFSAFQPNHPYNGMMGNPTTSRGKEGNLDSYRFEQNEHEEDEQEYYQPEVIERQVSDKLMESFRKRASMKTDMIILQLQTKYLYQKVLAKVIIQNKGDELIAKKHEDIDDEEIKELPKEIQKILRNQKHLKAIEGFRIEDYFKESCIEYFTMEFEEDYRNGLTPDFKDINPIELLTMKMQEPFNNLIADYAVDYALEIKPKIIQGIGSLKKKYIDSPIKEVSEQVKITNVAEQLIGVVEGKDESMFEDWNHPDNDHWDAIKGAKEEVKDKDVNDVWAEGEIKRSQNFEESEE